MTFFLSLLPVFAVILLGWGLRARSVIGPEGWLAINKLGYFVLLPAYLVLTVARADFSSGDAGRMVLAGIGGFGLMALVALATLHWTRRDGPAFTSLFQGAVRWNGVAMLAVVEALLGREGAAYLALVFGPSVLFVNVICVLVLLRWGKPERPPKSGALGTLAALLGNPMILACGLGLALNLASLPIPAPVAQTLDLLGRGALGLALLTAGAGIELDRVRSGGRLLALATGLKLFVAPLAFWLVGYALGIRGDGLLVLVAMGAAPGAANAYTLARQMGGDAALTAAHVTATTLLAALSLPLVLALAAG
jgi:predicted permease